MSSRRITHNGETLTCAEWGARLGISGKTLSQRIHRDGWSEVRAVTELPEKLLEYNGESHTMSEWARRFGISVQLVSQRTKRLGWSLEKALKAGPSNVTHGYTRGGRDAFSKEYRTWEGILRRCLSDKKQVRYYNKVHVCERWQGEDGFVNFLNDVGQAPSPEHTIERKKNSKGYEPGNVRWATVVEQARNKSTNVVLRHDGLALTIVEWAERLGLNAKTIYSRIEKGWTAGRALTTLGKANETVVEFSGARRSLSSWAKRLGIPMKTLSKRLRAGWTVDEALSTPVRRAS